MANAESAQEEAMEPARYRESEVVTLGSAESTVTSHRISHHPESLLVGFLRLGGSRFSKEHTMIGI